jgi:HicA toxin of bacterial toxin-antitoxin,
MTVPLPKSIAWRDIEHLLIGIECEVIEGNGSRVAFKFGDVRADFHRPHPRKEAKPYQVREVRAFLEVIGILEPTKATPSEEEKP